MPHAEALPALCPPFPIVDAAWSERRSRIAAALEVIIQLDDDRGFARHAMRRYLDLSEDR
ncbi:MAG: hypothetical protein KGZ68_18600 [Dechloromonas sp.]|nr:hypothetical protein [Dechloromonas sp.]